MVTLLRNPGNHGSWLAKALSPAGISPQMRGSPMRTLNTILDYALWPLLVIAALIPTSIGISAGHGKLAFNLTYFSFAAVLFILERLRPHEREWLKNDGQMVPDLAHTVFT